MTEPAYGYAKITRTSGIGAWTGYGVVNDAKTSDGSILPLYRPGGLAAARRLVVPVVLDVFGAAGSHYTTELTLANDGAFATPVDLFYKPALGSSTGVPFVTLTLAAGQQTTIPDVIAYLRTKGLNVPDASTGPQAGTLTVEFRNLFSLDAPRTVAIARTTTPNPNAATGGAFGVAYPAAAKGGGARASALVPGLTRDASVRSNLAVVHLGGGSESALSLSVQLYDASTGLAAGGPVTVTLQPGDWTQWSRDLRHRGRPGRRHEGLRRRDAHRGRRHVARVRRPERRADVRRQLRQDDPGAGVLTGAPSRRSTNRCRSSATSARQTARPTNEPTR